MSEHFFDLEHYTKTTKEHLQRNIAYLKSIILLEDVNMTNTVNTTGEY